MIPAPLSALVSILAVLAAVAGVTMVRRPDLRRLAVRSALNRPGETALVIVGALLGTAIVTGSLIVGDTIDRSLRTGAFTQLGPIDETVSAPGPAMQDRLRHALGGLEGMAEVDGTAYALRAEGTVVAGAEETGPGVAPEVGLLELDVEASRAFGGDPHATGLADASSPRQGTVALTEDLADTVGAAVGDEVEVRAYGTARTLRVTSLLPRRGLAGYGTGLDATRLNAVLAPGTLAAGWEESGRDGGHTPPVALAFVSNRGGVLDGVAHTEPVLDELEQRVHDLPYVRVTASKRELLDTAESVGANLTEVFLGVGAFAVMAGVLLLVNVFTMLAHERRRQLGILRAVGMRRMDVARAFLLEGGLYALIAAVLGGVAGLGVGAGIVRLAQGLSGGPAGFTVELRFAAEPASLALGPAIGLAISLLTIALTSVQIARTDTIRALRELPDATRTAPPGRLRAQGLLAASVGATVLAVGIARVAPAPMLLGPALIGLGVARALARPVRRLGVTGVAGGVLAWVLSAPAVMPDAFHDPPVAVFLLQGLLATGAAVALLAANQDLIGRLVRGVAGRVGNVTLRLGLAYPLARPVRTTLTLSMYALVVFTLVLVSLVAGAFGDQTDRFARAEAGGFDLLVDAGAGDPPVAERLAAVNGVRAVAPLHYARYEVTFRAPGHDGFRRWFASGFDRRLLKGGPPALDRFAADFASAGAVWRHVLEEPSAMIVGSRFLQEGGERQSVRVGDVVEVRDPLTGRSDAREVVGVMKGGLAFSGAFMAEESLTSVVGARATPSRYYLELDRGADPGRVAEVLETRFLEQGVRARSFTELVAERQQENRSFFRILQGYLLLGLLVGTAGVGVIMLRAVRERRAQIGTLRSAGVQAGTVAASFMLEAAFVALQGAAVGTVLARATAANLLDGVPLMAEFGAGASVPRGEVAALLAVTVLVSLAASGGPARRAAAIEPATMMRGSQ